MCMKFQRGDLCLSSNLLRDVLLLDGKAINKKGGVMIDCNYFIIQTFGDGYDSNYNARILRSFGLNVPFTQSQEIIFSNRRMNVTITEDLTEFGKYHVYPVSEYLEKNNNQKLKQQMEDILRDIHKRCFIDINFRHIPGMRVLQLTALENMFFVRTCQDIEELVANDFDHVNIRLK